MAEVFLLFSNAAPAKELFALRVALSAMRPDA